VAPLPRGPRQVEYTLRREGRSGYGAGVRSKKSENLAGAGGDVAKAAGSEPTVATKATAATKATPATKATAATKAAKVRRSATAPRRSPAPRTKKRAPRASERERAVQVIERLHQEMPDAKIELDFSNDLELLVAVILSAQCTDAMVNRCTPSLFAAFRTAADYAAAEPEDLYPHISRCGLYRNKAKNIVAAMRKIEEEHGGELPTTRALLEELPGVGRKTAGVVAVYAFDGQAFPVDTHVGRLARRLGFTREENPDKVEEDMQRLLPPSLWGQGHQLLVWHGRRCCYARKPACSRCVVADLCPKRGVKDAV